MVFVQQFLGRHVGMNKIYDSYYERCTAYVGTVISYPFMVEWLSLVVTSYTCYITAIPMTAMIFPKSHFIAV